VKAGSGVVRRMWMTLNDRSPKMLRGLKLEMYWDGAATPAVSAPVGDFFGVGLGRIVPFESAFLEPGGTQLQRERPHAVPQRHAHRADQ
jgi:hypothetical protein